MAGQLCAMGVCCVEAFRARKWASSCVDDQEKNNMGGRGATCVFWAPGRGVVWIWEYPRFLLELASLGDESHGGVSTCVGVGMMERSTLRAASGPCWWVFLSLVGTAKGNKKKSVV